VILLDTTVLSNFARIGRDEDAQSRLPIAGEEHIRDPRFSIATGIKRSPSRSNEPSVEKGATFQV
jgi:hypothetical protein